MALQGFTYMLSLPFVGIPGFTQKGFPGFSGWLTTVFEPTGWAEPFGDKFFWIANLLLWIGWINLYAGLFNCLPAVPLDGGHIFRDLVQTGFERVVKPKEAEKLTRTAVALLAWLVLTSLLITVIAPFTHWLSHLGSRLFGLRRTLQNGRRIFILFAPLSLLSMIKKR